MSKPLLLVDIDGVISLFGFDPARPPDCSYLAVEGILHFLSATAADHLRALADEFELVWCSGWEEKAEEYLRPALGLAEKLPHLRLGTPANAGHWKLGAIDAYAGPERPLAWIDDAHDAGARDWAERRPGPTLLVTTVPPVGLTGEHVRQLLDWAAEVGGPVAQNFP